MNENELYLVTVYEFANRLFNEIHSIIDSCPKNCHNKFFHTYEYNCNSYFNN